MMDALEEEILHLCEYYDFIKKELCFYNYREFVKNAQFIKESFKQSTKYEKQLYKLYVYANVHIELRKKNRIWDFLNDFGSFASLLEL